VVLLSSICAEKRHVMGFVDRLARIEQRLDAAREETGTALLHLRCGYFMRICSWISTGSGPAVDHHPAVGRPNAVGRPAGHRHRGHAAPARRRLDGPAGAGGARTGDLTWTEAAAALSTATGVSIKAQRITDDKQRAALRDADLERSLSRGSSA
jgi:hypothetical protein